MLPEDLSVLCLALMHPAPAHRPSPEQILAALIDASPDSTPRTGPTLAVPRASFVGRAGELAILEEAYGAAQVAGGGVVVAALAVVAAAAVVVAAPAAG